MDFNDNSKARMYKLLQRLTGPQQKGDFLNFVGFKLLMLQTKQTFPSAQL